MNDPTTLTAVDRIYFITDPAELSFYPLGRGNSMLREFSLMMDNLGKTDTIDISEYSIEAVDQFKRAINRSMYQLENIWIPRAELIESSGKHDDEMVKIIAMTLMRDASARDLPHLLVFHFMPIYRQSWLSKNSSYSREEVDGLARKDFADIFIASIKECHQWMRTLFANIDMQ